MSRSACMSSNSGACAVSALDAQHDAHRAAYKRHPALREEGWALAGRRVRVPAAPGPVDLLREVRQDRREDVRHRREYLRELSGRTGPVVQVGRTWSMTATTARRCAFARASAYRQSLTMSR
jgi:hypothetical protein